MDQSIARWERQEQHPLASQEDAPIQLQGVALPSVKTFPHTHQLYYIHTGTGVYAWMCSRKLRVEKFNLANCLLGVAGESKNWKNAISRTPNKIRFLKSQKQCEGFRDVYVHVCVCAEVGSRVFNNLSSFLGIFYSLKVKY